MDFPGTYRTTLTRPDLFQDYYREQIELLMRHHRVPVQVGVSDRMIPLSFVVEDATADIGSEDVRAMQSIFRLPDLAQIDDTIANGTHQTRPGHPFPLSLFTG